jgi:hypothetical protein
VRDVRTAGVPQARFTLIRPCEMFSGLFIAFMGAGYIMGVGFVKGGRSEE